MNLTKKQKELVEVFKKKPYRIRNGAGLLAKTYNCSLNDVYAARESLKEVKVKKKYEKIEGSVIDRVKGDENGNQLITIKSDGPLTPEQITEMVSVDGVTSYVTNYWVKSNEAGVWTYSVQIKNIVNGLFSLEDIKAKLEDIIPKIKPIKLNKSKYTNQEYTHKIVYISDIHAGAQNSELNIHNLSYSEEDLMERLETILDKLISDPQVYENLIVVNLGDSVDGWDGFTTRKGHSLGSMSNRDQFDIYFRCMSTFYSTLFESGIANNYQVWNCLDSNHEGVDFAYICNKNVENYLSNKYPQVEFTQQDKFIDVLQIGMHAFAFTHGKDGKIMKYPMKKNLDDKLDSWAQQYFHKLGYTHTWNHIVKGDLHSYAHERGKFGTYLNIPSIYGTSDYISLNFGVGRPGAVIEEVHEEIEETRITPIWL